MPGSKPENREVFKSTSTEPGFKKTAAPVVQPTKNAAAASPAVATSAPETAPGNLVNLKIITPGKKDSFAVELKDGQNVCDNLIQAKAEGKLTSLTINTSYLKTYGSAYVYEINGYKNNWTFTINGASPPTGCSDVFPKNNDAIVWTFK